MASKHQTLIKLRKYVERRASEVLIARNDARPDYLVHQLSGELRAWRMMQRLLNSYSRFAEEEGERKTSWQ